jgi:hypothetical protein
MQFCKDCGGVLNLFGTNDQELCSSCIQQKKRYAPVSAPAPVQKPQQDSFDLLNDAVLSYENTKIVLRSKEGWELWSAPTGTETDLQTILARARRIYQIRLKRQKN